MIPFRWRGVLAFLWLFAGCGSNPRVQVDDPVDVETQAIQNKAGVQGEERFGLNTYAWDYGPWMREFSTQFYETWRAPEAYLAGEISGSVFLKVTAEKTGEISEIEVTKHDGPESLVEAAVESVRKLSGLAPLPDHFPEEKLDISFRCNYPEFRK